MGCSDHSHHLILDQGTLGKGQSYNSHPAIIAELLLGLISRIFPCIIIVFITESDFASLDSEERFGFKSLDISPHVQFSSFLLPVDACSAEWEGYFIVLCQYSRDVSLEFCGPLNFVAIHCNWLIGFVLHTDAPLFLCHFNVYKHK